VALQGQVGVFKACVHELRYKICGILRLLGALLPGDFTWPLLSLRLPQKSYMHRQSNNDVPPCTASPPCCFAGTSPGWMRAAYCMAGQRVRRRALLWSFWKPLTTATHGVDAGMVRGWAWLTLMHGGIAYAGRCLALCRLAPAWLLATQSLGALAYLLNTSASPWLWCRCCVAQRRCAGGRQRAAHDLH
jgi:hypothetical protein